MPTGIGERKIAMNLTELNDLIRATPWLTFSRGDLCDREDTIYCIANYIGSAKIGTVLHLGALNGQPSLNSTIIKKIGNNNWSGFPFLYDGTDTVSYATQIYRYMKNIGNRYEIIRED